MACGHRSRRSGDVFGGGARYLDPEGQVECGWCVSLPERNNLAKGSVNNCSPGSSPSAGCAAAVAAAAAEALMNNAAHKESKVERVSDGMGHIFQPPTAMHELYHNCRTWDVPHHPPAALLDSQSRR